jgi:dolichyl-phosphate beta-glucosyltransferase
MISIILPAYNEQDRIASCLFNIHRWVLQHPAINLEVIVVNNGSTDRTIENALAMSSLLLFPVRVITIPERSKALAVKTGILAANGDILLMADVDLSTPTDEFPKFIDAVMAGADIVIGSRRMPGSQVTQSIKRRAIGWIFSLLTGLVLPGIKDTQCGFKAFRRGAGKWLFERMTMTSMAFDVEILLAARRKGYIISELPVQWKENTDSRVKLVQDSWRMAADVFRLMRWKPRQTPQALRA